jgi:hypothetical protein
MATGAEQAAQRLAPVPWLVDVPASRAEGTADELTVEVYLERWLAHAKGLLRGSTYDGYATLLRRHAIPRIGDVALSYPLRVQALYAELLADPEASGAGGHPVGQDRREPASGTAPVVRPGRALGDAHLEPAAGA